MTNCFGAGSAANPNTTYLGQIVGSHGNGAISYVPYTDSGNAETLAGTGTLSNSPGSISPTIFQNAANFQAAANHFSSDWDFTSTWKIDPAQNNGFPILRRVPDAPTSVTATAEDSQTTVTFITPASDGGLAISNYEYSTNNGTTWTALSPASTANSITITGLTNGTTYQVKLRALNSDGPGAGSVAATAAPRVSGPTLSSVSATATAGTTANLLATSSASGTGYWVVLAGAGATAPSAAQVKAGQNSGGSTSSPAVIASGSAAMTAASAKTFSLTGLTAGSSYTVCLVGNDGSNDSSVSCQNLTTGPAFTSLSPAAGSTIKAGSSIGYTLNETIASGRLTFTRTGGTADPDSPQTCTLQGTALASGARSVGLGSNANGCTAAVTLVDGAVYTVALAGTDAASLSSASTTIAGLSYDSTAPVNAGSSPVSGSKGSGNTVNSTVYEAQDIITVVFSEPVLVSSITGNAPAVSGGHALGSPLIAAVSASNGYATSFTLTLGSIGLSLAVGDTLTFTASNVVDRAGNLASSNVVFTVPAPTSITAPAAPTTVSATPGNAQATVSWTAPSNNGGTAITGYTVTASPGSATCTTTGATSCTVTGLTNGTAYTFTVIATNSVGSSSASAASTAAQPAPAIPDAPTIGSATPGNGSISVAFTAPANNGGASISEYTVSCDPVTSNRFTTMDWAASNTGSSSPITVSGLTNGSAYKCEVKAKNSAGYGSYSTASSAATPTAPVVTDNTPAPTTTPNATTLPTGGGTATPTAGQTVTVTDNGGNGSTISLPPPTTPTTPSTPGSGNTSGAGSTNSVNVALPGTGTVAVSSNSSGTQLQVQQITLAGTNTKVSTVSVSSGSATMTASGAGQTLVTTGVSNGLTVTSGGSGTTATVTASGNTQSIALTGTANLTLGNTLDTQRTSLTLNPGSSGQSSQANLQIGGQTLSIKTDGGSAQVQVTTSIINGQSVPTITVTGGTASITGQAGQVMNSLPVTTTTCNGTTTTNAGGYFEAVTNNAESNILSVNQGNLAVAGYIPSGVVVYHFVPTTATPSCNNFTMTTPLNGKSEQQVRIYQGEYVEVDKNGQPVKIVVRSKDGQSGGAGDPLSSKPATAKDAGNAFTASNIAGLSIDTIVPILDLSTGRLPSGQTITQSIQEMFKLSTTDWRISTQDSLGVIRITDGKGGKISALPFGSVLADAARPDGVQCYGNGLCQTIANNLITSFNAALDEPQAFISALQQADPAATLRINGEGNLQVSLNGRRYIGQVGWHVLPSSNANGFASDSSGGLWFAANSGKQALTPVLASFARLQTVLKQVDATGAAQGDHQGTVVVVLKGQSYRLKPLWEVINTPTAHAKEDYWADNGVLYLNYLDGTAQGMTVQ